VELNMRPAEVSAAGADLITMAEAARQRIAALFEAASAAATGNPGWAASASLTACRAAWEPRLSGTVDQTAELGQALAFSADAVTAADAEAARRLNLVVGDFGVQQ
jgi:hypothetical protein